VDGWTVDEEASNECYSDSAQPSNAPEQAVHIVSSADDDADNNNDNYRGGRDDDESSDEESTVIHLSYDKSESVAGGERRDSNIAYQEDGQGEVTRDDSVMIAPYKDLCNSDADDHTSLFACNQKEKESLITDGLASSVDALLMQSQLIGAQEEINYWKKAYNSELVLRQQQSSAIDEKEEIIKALKIEKLSLEAKLDHSFEEISRNKVEYANLVKNEELLSLKSRELETKCEAQESLLADSYSKLQLLARAEAKLSSQLKVMEEKSQRLSAENEQINASFAKSNLDLIDKTVYLRQLQDEIKLEVVKRVEAENAMKKSDELAKGSEGAVQSLKMQLKALQDG
jgi:hypothetical protein